MGGRPEAMSTGDIASAIRFEETAKGGRYFIDMPNGEQSRLTFVKDRPRPHHRRPHFCTGALPGQRRRRSDGRAADCRRASERAEDHAGLLVRGRRVQAASSGVGRPAAAVALEDAVPGAGGPAETLPHVRIVSGAQKDRLIPSTPFGRRCLVVACPDAGRGLDHGLQRAFEGQPFRTRRIPPSPRRWLRSDRDREASGHCR